MKIQLKRKFREMDPDIVYESNDEDEESDVSHAAKRQHFYVPDLDTDTSSPPPLNIIDEHINFPICDEILDDFEDSPSFARSADPEGGQHNNSFSLSDIEDDVEEEEELGDYEEDENVDADVRVGVTTSDEGVRELFCPESLDYLEYADTPAADVNDVHVEEFRDETRTHSTLSHVDELLQSVMSPPEDDLSYRPCPLPALSWGNAAEVWHNLCANDREEATRRNGDMLSRHPELKPRMRSILLEWLMVVCHEKNLHRETYYLAVDYLDRYLAAKRNVKKTFLQLIGVTCLFVAAKVEEIYPPKVADLENMTADAFTANDIMRQEIVLLQVLDWQINPVTPISWLGTYMQLRVCNHSPTACKSLQEGDESTSPVDIDRTFLYKQFSVVEFAHTAQLLDLCSLDQQVAGYAYSVLAAAAISYTYSPEVAMAVSGLGWDSISECARWMEPYYDVIVDCARHVVHYEENGQIGQNMLTHLNPKINLDEECLRQTLDINLRMLDMAHLRQQDLLARQCRLYEQSPRFKSLAAADNVLTPPTSGQKSPDLNNDDGHNGSSL